MSQPYETTPSPMQATELDGPNPPSPPVHDEPDLDPSVPVSVEDKPDALDDPFGWEPLEEMTLEEKVDQTLTLLRVFTDQVHGITSLVEQEGVGNLVTKAMTGQL